MKTMTKFTLLIQNPESLTQQHLSDPRTRISVKKRGDENWQSVVPAALRVYWKHIQSWRRRSTALCVMHHVSRGQGVLTDGNPRHQIRMFYESPLHKRQVSKATYSIADHCAVCLQLTLASGSLLRSNANNSCTSLTMPGSSFTCSRNRFAESDWKLHWKTSN